MQSSDSFNLFTQNDNHLDLYTLLPACWQAMTPAKKILAVSIVRGYCGNIWGVDCCCELCQKLKVNLTDLKGLQPSIFLVMELPSHLTRGIVGDEDVTQETLSLENQQEADKVAMVEAAHVKASNGLSVFHRYPNGLKGISAFNNQVAFRYISYAKKPEEHRISEHLSLSPRTPHQRSLMSIKYHHQVLISIQVSLSNKLLK